MNKDRLKTAAIVRKLPDIYRRRDRLPSGVIGARIVDFGTLRDPTLAEGGGLVIDYQPAGSESIRRVVLAFNELGMWIDGDFP